jgi:copper chaperone CopZ
MPTLMLNVFDVENAGCQSCATKVRAALSPLGEVREVVVDEARDTATVHLLTAAEVEQRQIDGALEEASADAGHAYRVNPGSWRVQAA